MANGMSVAAVFLRVLTELSEGQPMIARSVLDLPPSCRGSFVVHTMTTTLARFLPC
jgi:hypothetical protein